MNTDFFRGCVPALMTPCGPDGSVNFDALVRKGSEMMDAGMTAVVYCGSMGDWPLVGDDIRREGVTRLAKAGIPVVVGTGAVNTATAVAHAAHAQSVGAAGLMVIPRLLSRGTSVAAQRNHFESILSAAPRLPSVIYNSPYYGYETRADLFFQLRASHRNLVGFKEFGGASSLSYAAEHITNAASDLMLLVGVDTQVFHGFTRCGAAGAITGIGNCLPSEILQYFSICKAAGQGDAEARRLGAEMEDALQVLSTFDEGPDLVLYYKYLLVLLGEKEYEHHFNPTDKLSDSQRVFAERQLAQFRNWYDNWPGRKWKATS